MNAGMIIGIVLMAWGGITLWGMFFSGLKFFYNMSASTIYFAIAAVICGFMVAVCADAYSISQKFNADMYSISQKYKLDEVNAEYLKYKDECTICGGETKCEICGASGLYCEYASYGAGNDHFCNTHWPDVVEWHEKKK